jgi:sterol carrier protein 2
MSRDFAVRNNLDRCVSIAAQAMTTDRPGTFDKRSLMALVGAEMTREAANKVYEQAEIEPKDVDVVELHDCFAQNEVITYEGLRLCEDGGAEKFVVAGANTYGGRVVINPWPR